MLDLVVIGAGPHALSLLTRLIDDDPDLLTEQTRSSLLPNAKKTAARPYSEVRAHLKKRFAGSLQGVAVVDMYGRFMAQWERDFSALGITHTRSHANMHTDPYDFQSLQVWADTQRRQSELWHMHYVDREACRAQGYNGPYELPSTKLVNDFHRSLVDRYGLAPIVRRATVEDIRVVIPPPAAAGPDASASDPPPCTFALQLSDGSELTARRVVCAMGLGPMFRGMRATLPWWADDLAASLSATRSKLHVPRLAHSSQLAPWLQDDASHTDACCKSALHGQRVLVIGGGQTAGHLGLLAIRRGATVTLAARRGLSLKPYDVELSLVGNHRGERLNAFSKLSMKERVRFIKEARGGGSMAPELYHGLLAHSPGSMTLLEEVEVATAEWNGEEIVVRFYDGDGDVHAYDYVWLATGGSLDLGLVPIFARLLAQRPIGVTAGLPHLQPDLAWDAKCPLHVMGAFAQLQLGPDALNLAGARSGGVLVANACLKAYPKETVAMWRARVKGGRRRRRRRRRRLSRAAGLKRD